MGLYVDTALGPVHEVDYGGSGPNLVLVHGLGGSTTNWDAVAPSLAANARVRAIDLPGFGLTPPRADYSLDTHRDSVVAYLETFEGRFTLVGNSNGGLISAMIASRRPDLVERLVMVSPATPPVFPDPRRDWPTVIRLAIQATPPLGEIYGRHFIRSNSPEELVKKSLAMVTHKPGRVPMGLIESSREMARIRTKLPWAEHATARTATSIAAFYARRSAFLDMVRRIEAPTLVVQGVSDHIVSPTSVEWLCSLRPDWDLARLDDTGHTPQMDAPLRFLEAVEPWLFPAERAVVGA
ncbi:MAG TPA: alpha/beta hydrolase [Acidimicrobiia bacterium]|nr:alpha/beta hydrolase [Acidimicrobiia bacterium]